MTITTTDFLEKFNFITENNDLYNLWEYYNFVLFFSWYDLVSEVFSDVSTQ